AGAGAGRGRRRDRRPRDGPGAAAAGRAGRRRLHRRGRAGCARGAARRRSGGAVAAAGDPAVPAARAARRRRARGRPRRAARLSQGHGDAVILSADVVVAPAGDVKGALRAVAFHRAHGTTTMLASLVTAAPRELRRAVDGLAELVVDGE